MYTLLNDIELDIQELKCLLQAISNDSNAALRMVAKRNIRQMKTRLDELTDLLEETPAVTEQTMSVNEPMVTVNAQDPTSSSILAERIRPAASLRQAISLNDVFRFTRELFNGDTDRMNDVVRRLGESASLDEAIALFRSEVCQDEENEAVPDFIELLKKYFC